VSGTVTSPLPGCETWVAAARLFWQRNLIVV